MKSKIILGNIGENIASKFLERKGFEIIDRNFRCKCGEIDIIAMKNEEIAFVEVKTRSSNIYGDPEDAVNKIKKAHILRTAKYYLQINKLQNINIRFDVVSIYFFKSHYKIKHFESIDID